MATVRISQLTAITTPTDDDVLIINDADTNTRKITFGNLTAGLLSTSGTAQTKSGALTVGGTLTASGNLVVDTSTLFVDSTTNKVGINTAAPGVDLDVDGDIRVRNQGELQLGDSNNSNYIGLKAPSAIATDFALTLPAALPATGNFITYDTAGLASFDTNTAYASNELRAPYLGARGVGSNVGELRLYELPTNGGDYISIQAPTSLASVQYYTLPSNYPGSNGFVLSSTTTGTLSWVSNASAAAGSAGYLQYNTGGSLDASASLTWDSITSTLTTAGLSATGDTTLGNTSGDNLTVNATVISNVVPTNNAYDLGGASNYWQTTYSTNVAVGSGEIVHNGLARQTVYTDPSTAAAASFDVNLDSETSYFAYKLLILARDTVTDDTQSFEYLVTQDGNGNIDTLAYSGVDSGAGALVTASTAIVTGDVVVSLTNVAVSTNAVKITVLATSLNG